MRALKAILCILIFLIVTSIPIAAYALTVTANGVVIGSSTTTTVDASGVATTTVNLNNTVGVFTITGTAVAEQSGSTERILFVPIDVVGLPGQCTSSNPCPLEINASSDPSDFPTAKKGGGYSSGVVISATLSGTGNTISATGTANSDVINFVPAAQPGDGPVTLPQRCAASTTCSDPDFLSDLLSENIQLPCATGAFCTPSQSFTINMKFVGTSANIPAAGIVQSRTHSAADLLGTLPAVSGTSLKLSQTLVDIIRLLSFPDLSNADFTLNTLLAVMGNGIINPLSEDVSFSVGPFVTTIPAGSFTQIPQGRFAFKGVINGVALTAQIAPLGGNNWQFKVDGNGANLTGTRNPVPVGLKIGDKSGPTWVTADFLLAP